jgi:drug/metabolite transporter (DMT)-like permease
VSVSRDLAIWNTNAFFAYIIAVKVFGLKWQPKRLLAVILATIGVLFVVYGGVESPKTSIEDADLKEAATTATTATKTAFTPSAPLLGDLLTLLASVLYGTYQVMYKKYAALSTDQEDLSEAPYSPIGDDDDDSADEAGLINDHPARAMANAPAFGLHANLLTSTMGCLTLILLWIPLPVLHYLDIEKFAFPSDFKTAAAIAGIALSGLVFNSGFMVRLFAISLPKKIMKFISLRCFWVYGDPSSHLLAVCLPLFSFSYPM